MIYGDNIWGIKNSDILDNLSKNKYFAIAYQSTRDAAVVGIVHPIQISGENNFSNIMKSQFLGLNFGDFMGD